MAAGSGQIGNQLCFTAEMEKAGWKISGDNLNFVSSIRFRSMRTHNNFRCPNWLGRLQTNEHDLILEYDTGAESAGRPVYSGKTDDGKSLKLQCTLVRSVLRWELRELPETTENGLDKADHGTLLLYAVDPAKHPISVSSPWTLGGSFSSSLTAEKDKDSRQPIKENPWVATHPIYLGLKLATSTKRVVTAMKVVLNSGTYFGPDGSWHQVKPLVNDLKKKYCNNTLPGGFGNIIFKVEAGTDARSRSICDVKVILHAATDKLPSKVQTEVLVPLDLQATSSTPVGHLQILKLQEVELAERNRWVELPMPCPDNAAYNFEVLRSQRALRTVDPSLIRSRERALTLRGCLRAWCGVSVLLMGAFLRQLWNDVGRSLFYDDDLEAGETVNLSAGALLGSNSYWSLFFLWLFVSSLVGFLAMGRRQILVFISIVQFKIYTVPRSILSIAWSFIGAGFGSALGVLLTGAAASPGIFGGGGCGAGIGLFWASSSMKSKTNTVASLGYTLVTIFGAAVGILVGMWLRAGIAVAGHIEITNWLDLFWWRLDNKEYLVVAVGAVAGALVFGFIAFKWPSTSKPPTVYYKKDGVAKTAKMKADKMLDWACKMDRYVL
jgi:hypothetical protein